MSFLGTRNAVSIGVSQHVTMGGPNLLGRLSPSLLLNFAGAETLDPRITFTRASSATRFDSTGTLVTMGNNEARFDYDPVTLQPRGLLIEEQRTNSIRNPTMQGAVAGTPGTLPTNWQTASAAGLSTEVVGTGTENGINYIDFRFFGTATTTSASSIQFEQNTGIPASNGQTWTLSAFLKRIAGSQSGIAALRLGWEERSNVFLVQQQTAPITLPTAKSLSSTRFSITAANGNASTTFIKPFVVISATSIGAEIDITLRIGLPQLELGAFASSPILSSGAATTRAADVAVMTGTNFSSWYNATEGTLYGEAAVLSTGYTSGVLLDVGAGGAFGSTAYVNWFGAGWALSPAAAPVNMLSSTTTTSPGKIAAGLASNNAVVAANGLIGLTDTSCSMPLAPTTLSIGKAGWAAGAYFNGHIRRIAYYPRRLANSELRAITA